MANRKRKCKWCAAKDLKVQWYEAENMVITPKGSFCSMDHALEFAKENQEAARERIRRKASAEQRKKDKERRAETKRRKEAVRPRSWYVKEAQKWFNKFIRIRDKGLPCICCDRLDDGLHQRHAGHFLTVGARPEHRFNEDNCHAQTSYCNNHLSGNVAEYRKRLITKIGIDRVEAIEQDHDPKKYSIDELKQIITTYKDKFKKLS